jgi:hypothetical protein
MGRQALQVRVAGLREGRDVARGGALSGGRGAAPVGRHAQGQGDRDGGQQQEQEHAAAGPHAVTIRTRP